MRLFINTANVETVQRYADYGIVEGVTTNPSVIAAERKDMYQVVTTLAGLVQGPVMAQVTARNAEKMLEQAKEISSWAPNIVVKMPAIPEGFKAMYRACEAGLPITSTLVYTPTQAMLSAKLGVKYVASFVKRQDAIASSGVEVLKKVVHLFRTNGYTAQILAAGVATHLEIVECAMAGVDSITMDPPFFEEMMKHPMSDMGLDGFIEDFNKYVRLIQESGERRPGWLTLLAEGVEAAAG